jgi:hypothetical protein
MQNRDNNPDRWSHRTRGKRLEFSLTCTLEESMEHGVGTHDMRDHEKI